MTSELAVSTAGLVKEYPGGAGLHGVDVSVPAGGTYGLVGANGAGKTTLLNLLCGLRQPDSGEVHLAVKRSRLSVCPDVPTFEPWLRCEEVLELACGMAGAPVSRDHLDRTLAKVGMREVATRAVGGFSRGMTQRLGLAAALVTDPQLLIVDEPTSALDPAGRAEVLQILRELPRSTTVVMSSHNLSEVQRVAETTGVLRDGRLIYEGGTRDLIDRHLRPRWEIRIRGDADDLAAGLRREDWVEQATAVNRSTVHAVTSTLSAGEAGLVQVLAVRGAQVISMTPLDADLEAAFLSLTAGAA